MEPCFRRYGVEDIIVWNDEEMTGQLTAWTDCAAWIATNRKDYIGTWHLEDDVIPCKDFKTISETVIGEGNMIVQGFITDNPFSDFKGETGILPVRYLPYGMQCLYIPNDYLKGFIYFADNYVKPGLYHKRQYECGTLYSDNVLRGMMRKYYPNAMVNILEKCMVEHIDDMIGGRSIRKQAYTKRKARSFDNLEEVEQLRKWVKAYGYNGQTKN